MKPLSISQTKGSAPIFFFVFCFITLGLKLSLDNFANLALERDEKTLSTFIQNNVQRSTLLTNSSKTAQEYLLKNNKNRLYCGTQAGMEQEESVKRQLFKEKNKANFSPDALAFLCHDMPRMLGTIVIQQKDAFYIPLNTDDKLSTIPEAEIQRWLSSVDFIFLRQKQKA